MVQVLRNGGEFSRLRVLCGLLLSAWSLFTVFDRFVDVLYREGLLGRYVTDLPGGCLLVNVHVAILMVWVHVWVPVSGSLLGFRS